MKTLLATLLLILTGASAHAQLEYSQTDFKYLYNTHRASQTDPLPWPGTYWPFEGHGTGSGINHKVGAQSPAEKYDLFFGTGGKAAKWEEANHTCTGMTGEQLADCQEWYGHCNGWTGAALFNPEPDADKPVTVTSPVTKTPMTFEAHDLKAFLSEIWLDSSVSYDGTGTTIKADKWIYDPNDPISKQPAANNTDLTNYEAYWDVTPRAMFYALTNYVGELKAGLAIDRFTGSEIWNQPLIAYRLLPIKGAMPAPITRNGATLYPVNLGVKLYWMNDDVDYQFKRTDSIGWSITDPKFSPDSMPTNAYANDTTADSAVQSRYMEMTLFFDAPVTMNADGTQVATAGHMVGDGMWAHADPAQRAKWYGSGPQASQLHPDFLWRPDSLSRSASYRNPYLDPTKIYQFIFQKPIPDSSNVLKK